MYEIPQNRAQSMVIWVQVMYSDIHPVIRKVLKMKIWGVSQAGGLLL